MSEPVVVLGSPALHVPHIISISEQTRSNVNTSMHLFFFFSSRRRHTRFKCDWSSDVCSSDLTARYRTGGSARGACRRCRSSAGLRCRRAGSRLPVGDLYEDRDNVVAACLRRRGRRSPAPELSDLGAGSSTGLGGAKTRAPPAWIRSRPAWVPGPEGPWAHAE